MENSKGSGERQVPEGVEQVSSDKGKVTWEDLTHLEYPEDDKKAGAPEDTYTVDEIMAEFSGGGSAGSEQVTPEEVEQNVAIIQGAADIGQGGAVRGRHEAPAAAPEVSAQEIERRRKADIDTIGSRMSHYEGAFRERNVPMEALEKAGLALDVLDELSIQMEGDEDSGKTARERLSAMASAYDKLYKRTEIPGRKKKYYDMPAIARSESGQFMDWDGKEKAQKSVTERTMQKLSAGLW